MADCTACLGLEIFIMILDRFSIWISSEKQWKEDYRTTGELLEWDGERHESQRNTSLFSETCKFHFSLATSGVMNFHLCCTLQDLLYVLLTLRKVIKGISQLQDSPRSGLLLTERKSIIILISFPDFSLPLHSLSFLQSGLLFSFDYLFPRNKKENPRATYKCTRCPWISTQSTKFCPCNTLFTNKLSSNSEQAFNNKEMLETFSQ